MKTGMFISQVYQLNNKFSFVSSNVKGRLLQTYCSSWYGCQNWELKTKLTSRADTMWNKAVRRMLRIPYTAHRHLLPLLVQGCSFAEQHRARVAKFMQSFCSTSNDLVRLIGERARCSTTGVLGRNWVKCTAHVPLGLLGVNASATARVISRR